MSEHLITMSIVGLYIFIGLLVDTHFVLKEPEEYMRQPMGIKARYVFWNVCLWPLVLIHFIWVEFLQ